VIPLSTAAQAAIQGSYVQRLRVESWLDDELLAEDVPVSDGAEEIDCTLKVPERVTLTVPRFDRGVSWDPLDATDPLAPYGQRLRVSLGIDLGNDQIEWLERGWFYIANSDTDGDTVRVEARGLLGLIEEARFTAPFQATGTFGSTLRALIEPALTADMSAELTDRAVPSSMSWDEDRIGALSELLDAWPADARVYGEGILQVMPAVDEMETDAVAVGSLTDGQKGTVVQWSGTATRDGKYNAVVARGQKSDGSQIQAVAYDTESSLHYGGPFNPLPVPYLYFSPLLTTKTQCAKAARSILARLRRGGDRIVTATMVPNPAVQCDDVLSVTAENKGLSGALCRVDGMHLPYTPDGGAMGLTLRVIG
jgi:hypothetical protein